MSNVCIPTIPKIVILLSCSDIQCCSVEPLPEPNFIKKFEGKEVADEITRFYHTNNVKQFVLKRPFHKGKKDKTNEYKV